MQQANGLLSFPSRMLKKCLLYPHKNKQQQKTHYNSLPSQVEFRTCFCFLNSMLHSAVAL